MIFSGSVVGVGSTLAKIGIVAGLKWSSSNTWANSSAAVAIKGEWNAPETFNGTANLALTASTTPLTALGSPEITTCPSLLSLAITAFSAWAIALSRISLLNFIKATILPPWAWLINSARCLTSFKPVVKS